jgi:catechol 2,3-dioxygenase-like lactoylglutathione lyase family enzyme
MQAEYRQGDASWEPFAFAQFAFPGGGRVELLAPSNDTSGFVVKFLERHGEGVHHLTFVVDDLRAETERLRAAGQRVFGEDYSNPHWMEAFISPGLAGSRVLIQLAQSDQTADEQDELWRHQPLGAVLEIAASRAAGASGSSRSGSSAARR